MTDRRSAPGTGLALLGLALGLAGIASYFVIVLHFGAWLPGVRNDALPNWAIIAAGVAIAVVGARRALAAPAKARRRWLAPTLAITDIGLASAFAWMLYVASAVPVVPGPAIGSHAPDFSLTAQDGRRVGLADFAGRPLLLVFYRGHW